MRIELRRCGVSYVAEACIPLVARVMDGPRYGADLLAGDKVSDVAYAKDLLQARLDGKFRAPVEIAWADATADREREPGEGD